MQHKELSDLLCVEMNCARAHYIEARTAFQETLNEIRRVSPADAGPILRLAVEECNRAFEIFSQAERAYADFVTRDEIPIPDRAA